VLATAEIMLVMYVCVSLCHHILMLFKSPYIREQAMADLERRVAVCCVVLQRRIHKGLMGTHVTPKDSHRWWSKGFDVGGPLFLARERNLKGLK
jgi:hypothetical protein